MHTLLFLLLAWHLASLQCLRTWSFVSFCLRSIYHFTFHSSGGAPNASAATRHVFLRLFSSELCSDSERRPSLFTVSLFHLWVACLLQLLQILECLKEDPLGWVDCTSVPPSLGGLAPTSAEHEFTLERPREGVSVCSLSLVILLFLPVSSSLPYPPSH